MHVANRIHLITAFISGFTKTAFISCNSAKLRHDDCYHGYCINISSGSKCYRNSAHSVVVCAAAIAAIKNAVHNVYQNSINCAIKTNNMFTGVLH